MSQALYEQYKEALRRGHVAALRGRLAAAEAAYRAAAGIAPDRALPYASLGGVLGRLGRSEEALAAYSAALDRGPDDEGALGGRAELQAAQGRRAEAAVDFDRLAVVLEGAGRLTDACDAARRALELGESPTRRHELERLETLLRLRDEDRPAVDALDRALRILEAADAAGAAAGTSGDRSATANGETSEPSVQAAFPAPPEAEPEPEPEPEREPPPPPPPDPAVLRAVADALLDDGDIAGARERLLALASLHRAAGRHDAAMDACLALLAVTPADHRLQREIAGIQLDRGWTAVADEKLRLLARLADLDGDDDARAAIAALAVERGLEVPELPVPAA
jgi:tetratricopeptide (TPR) repeat protein